MDFQNYIDSRLLFSVPIYFRSQEEHRQYFNDQRQSYLEEQERSHRQFTNSISIQDKMGWELDFERIYNHTWKYTEVIGYIEFRKKGESIFSFIFLPEVNRYGPLMKRKKFKIAQYFPDYEIEISELTNEQIIEQIHDTIYQIHHSSRRFKRYYIDTYEMMNYVSLIDYKNIFPL